MAIHELPPIEDEENKNPRIWASSPVDYLAINLNRHAQFKLAISEYTGIGLWIENPKMALSVIRIALNDQQVDELAAELERYRLERDVSP